MSGYSLGTTLASCLSSLECGHHINVPRASAIHQSCPKASLSSCAQWTHKEMNCLPLAIVGVQEYIFSENIGILGDLAARKEQTFGTLTAHHLAWIGGKLHYGHLDFLNATFMSMHGGVSKV